MKSSKSARLESIVKSPRWSFIRSVAKHSSQNRISISAASLAFHWSLAIFPAAIALVGLAHLLTLSTKQINSISHGFTVLLPGDAATLVTQALKLPESSGTSGMALATGLIVSIWSMTGAMASLQVGLDVAFEIKKDKGFLKRRIASIPLVGISLLLGGTASVLLVLGGQIANYIIGSFYQSNFLGLKVIVTILIYLGAAGIVLLLISIYYIFGPNRGHIIVRNLRFSDIFNHGAFVALILWVTSSILSSYYFQHFGRQLHNYGVFADVTVLLLWLYMTSASVLIGAETSRELERRLDASQE
ncbi:MAG: YihY/virulence factor BrkB family protein [Acidimicrobiales bacterium]|nr:YihY/virulence factor BrkB family protein [Acidimicrobiales bacterium]